MGCVKSRPEVPRLQGCSLAQAPCGIWVGGGCPNLVSEVLAAASGLSPLCLLLFPGLHFLPLHRPQRRFRGSCYLF